MLGSGRALKIPGGLRGAADAIVNRYSVEVISDQDQTWNTVNMSTDPCASSRMPNVVLREGVGPSDNMREEGGVSQSNRRAEVREDERDQVIV